VATDRYKEGKASYYEVLEAQQQLYPAENTLSHVEVGRRLAIVQLYKALGGGWEKMEPSAQLQSPPPAK
jgi:multidrug efflux system outer membrane protein